MCIELMLNAVNLLMVAFSKCTRSAMPPGLCQLRRVTVRFCFFIMVVAAAEVSVGLAIIVMLYRNTHSIDEFLKPVKKQQPVPEGTGLIIHMNNVLQIVADSHPAAHRFLINGLGRNVLSKSIAGFVGCISFWHLCHEPLAFMQVREAIPIVRIISIL